jgi:hypothetical protein
MLGLLLTLMAATLLVMCTGVVAMAGGGEFNRRYGNRIMVARVVLQALTIGMLVLMAV